jgi:hypothetical protein
LHAIYTSIDTSGTTLVCTMYLRFGKIKEQIEKLALVEAELSW